MYVPIPNRDRLVRRTPWELRRFGAHTSLYTFTRNRWFYVVMSFNLLEFMNISHFEDEDWKHFLREQDAAGSKEIVSDLN